MEGLKGCMESYAVTRRILLYNMTGGKIIRQPHYHYTHSRCGSVQITVIIPMLGLIRQPGLALRL